MTPGELPAQFPGWDDFELGALAVSEPRRPRFSRPRGTALPRSSLPRLAWESNEWTVINPNTEKMIENAALAFSQSMNETTSLDLDKALKQTREALHTGNITHGESIDQLTTRINAIFDGADTGGRPDRPHRDIAGHAPHKSSPRSSRTWSVAGNGCRRVGHARSAWPSRPGQGSSSLDNHSPSSATTRSIRRSSFPLPTRTARVRISRS